MRWMLASVSVLLLSCSPPGRPAPATGADLTAPSQAVAEVVAPPKAASEECGYGGCEGPFYDAAVADFGSLPMGAQVNAIPSDAVEHHGDCAGPDVYCGFQLADGVRYSVWGTTVVAKRVPVTPGSQLPFGLSGRETPEQALLAMRRVVSAPARVVQRDDGVRLVSQAGHFTEVILQGPPAV
jgi:hypothetical protein